jgi:hypothetical protein
MTATRDHVGRFASGTAGGPGRPRNGVRAALARLVDFDEIAKYVYAVALDPEADPKDRQWAIAFITDRLEGRAVQAVAMQHQLAAATSLPPGFDALPDQEKDRVLDAIASGAPLALPGVIDVE